MEEVDKKINK